jgi:glutamyl-tRNA reductase
MEIFVIGLNHRSAPLPVREQYSLPPELARQFLHAVHKESFVEEALVLDTCNRTEFYAVADAPPSVAHLLKHIAHARNRKPAAEPPPFYRLQGPAAVEHLFRVAASLDSQVVGEHEILGQLKDAYRLALEAHTSHFIMNRLMHSAFRVGKRVRTETRLGRGATSLAESAVDLSRRVLGDLDGKTVLLIGAGQTAEKAAQALLRFGATKLIVANRSLAAARQLSEKLLSEPAGAAEMHCPALRRKGARCSLNRERATSQKNPRTVRAISLSKIASVLPRVDLLISSTASPDCVLTREHFAGRRRRAERPLLIVDLAVPRDVDPRITVLPNISLCNIDDLDRIVGENLQQRRREIPRAEDIVGEEVRRFGEWLESLDAVHLIKLLRARATALQEAEVRRYRNKFSPADRERLELFAHGLCSKVLRDPIAFLCGSVKFGGTPSPADMDVVRRMFRLNSAEDDC